MLVVSHFLEALKTNLTLIPCLSASLRCPGALLHLVFHVRECQGGAGVCMWVTCQPIPPWRNSEESLFTKSSNVNTKTIALTCSPQPFQKPSREIWLIPIYKCHRIIKKSLIEDSVHFVCFFGHRWWSAVDNLHIFSETRQQRMLWCKRQIRASMRNLAWGLNRGEHKNTLLLWSQQKVQIPFHTFISVPSNTGSAMSNK